METKDRKGTLIDAIEAVSTMDIIDAYGIPNRTRRGRTYLLCPGHDDRHFGSCYIDKNDNGYYCYVCGEHVTKWNMVLRLNDNSKSNAREWFFRMSGITPVEERVDDPYRKVSQLIRQLEKYIRNDVVYNDTCVCNKIDSSYGRNINGEYLYSEATVANPLMEMYKTSKQTFKQVVADMLSTEINKITKVMNSYNKHPDECVYIDGVGLVPYADMATSCNSLIANIQALRLSVDQL